MKLTLHKSPIQSYNAMFVSKSGFLEQSPRPPWGPRAEAEQGPKLGIFIDEQGPEVLRVF